MANRLKTESLKSENPSSQPCRNIRGQMDLLAQNKELLSLCVGVQDESGKNMMMPVPVVIKGSFLVCSLDSAGDHF